jgi:hypothetical protein
MPILFVEWSLGQPTSVTLIIGVRTHRLREILQLLVRLPLRHALVFT